MILKWIRPLSLVKRFLLNFQMMFFYSPSFFGVFRKQDHGRYDILLVIKMPPTLRLRWEDMFLTIQCLKDLIWLNDSNLWIAYFVRIGRTGGSSWNGTSSVIFGSRPIRSQFARLISPNVNFVKKTSLTVDPTASGTFHLSFHIFYPLMNFLSSVGTIIQHDLRFQTSPKIRKRQKNVKGLNPMQLLAYIDEILHDFEEVSIRAKLVLSFS